MDTLNIILAAVGTLGTASGWIAAYFAQRGTATAEREGADRMRIATARAEALESRAVLAEAQAATAGVELRAARVEADVATKELALERAQKGQLLERLAKLDIPVGDVLVDDALDRLYTYGDGARGGQGADAGRGSDGVPTNLAAAVAAPGKG